MAELIRAKISEINVIDRARPIDEGHAQAIAASMAERGQINPITVRRTPNANRGKTPLTLVAGGHRLRGAVINGWDELDAIIVSADAVEAQLVELSENLYRNELSALDRAIFVLKYRELWEEKHGKIDPKGGRPGKQGTECPVIFAPGRELSKQVRERLGFGETTYKKVTRIGQNLHPDLRALLRGTGAEDDQSLLLKLAKKGPSEQATIAGMLREERNIRKVLAGLKGEKAKVDPQEEIFQKVAALLSKADDATLVRILHHIGDMRDVSFLEAAE
ncbi:ParB N-terminal domain-containing protein [Shinella sp. BYT-45]|uniref:ParB N-terminal domain-containing protein n=1 Tax=Shinella sp. BYT-45 TaxID=3377377 RepID=UPI00397FAEC1